MTINLLYLGIFEDFGPMDFPVGRALLQIQETKINVFIMFNFYCLSVSHIMPHNIPSLHHKSPFTNAF